MHGDHKHSDQKAESSDPGRIQARVVLPQTQPRPRAVWFLKVPSLVLQPSLWSCVPPFCLLMHSLLSETAEHLTVTRTLLHQGHKAAHRERQWTGSPRAGVWKEEILKEAGARGGRGALTKHGPWGQARLAHLCWPRSLTPHLKGTGVSHTPHRAIIKIRKDDMRILPGTQWVFNKC